MQPSIGTATNVAAAGQSNMAVDLASLADAQTAGVEIFEKGEAGEEGARILIPRRKLLEERYFSRICVYPLVRPVIHSPL